MCARLPTCACAPCVRVYHTGVRASPCDLGWLPLLRVEELVGMSLPFPIASYPQRHHVTLRDCPALAPCALRPVLLDT